MLDNKNDKFRHFKLIFAPQNTPKRGTVDCKRNSITLSFTLLICSESKS